MAGFREKLDRHIQMKGVTYWFKMTLPRDMPPHFDGKKSILQSLKTGDKKTARDRRDDLEKELKDLFKVYCAGGTEAVPKVKQALDLGALLKQSLKQTEDPHERDIILSIA